MNRTAVEQPSERAGRARRVELRAQDQQDNAPKIAAIGIRAPHDEDEPVLADRGG